MELDQIVDWSNKLYGLPGAALVFLLCIVIGYMLRGIKRFPNEAIPVVCLVIGGALLPIIGGACPSELSLVTWRVKNLIVGCIVGGAAWGFHRIVLKKLETKFPWVKDWLDSNDTGKTQFFLQQNGAAKPTDSPLAPPPPPSP